MNDDKISEQIKNEVRQLRAENSDSAASVSVYKTPVAGEDEGEASLNLPKLEIGYVEGFRFHVSPERQVPPTPASGFPDKAKELEMLNRDLDHTGVTVIHNTYLDDNCKDGGLIWTGNDYKRDRSGSKKKVRKSVRRAKAKAAKRARKAQR